MAIIRRFLLSSVCLLLACGSEPNTLAEELRLSIVSGNFQTGGAGTQLEQPLVVRLTDKQGTPVANRRVDWRPNGGRVTPGEGLTDGNGLAATSMELGQDGGVITVEASSAGAEPVSFSITVEGPEQLVRMVSATPIPGDDGIHGITVRDGIAIVSAWNAGVQIFDVGNGIRDGYPSAPIKLSTFFPDPSGMTCYCINTSQWFHNPVTGEKRYLFVGQQGPGTLGEDASGDIHVLDIEDLTAPREVAVISVPDAGIQNFELDESRQLLYGAWNNGGVVKVDVSGTLNGGLSQRILGQILPGASDGRTYIRDLHAAGNTIFAVDWARGLWVLNASDLSVAGGGDNIPERFSGKVWSEGSLVYTGGALSKFNVLGNVVKIWDVTNVTNPVLVDSLTYPGVNTITAISSVIPGQLLLVAAEGGNRGGFTLYRLSGGSHPVSLARVQVTAGLHSAVVSQVAGRTYVFGARNGAAGVPSALVVYDISGAVNQFR